MKNRFRLLILVVILAVLTSCGNGLNGKWISNYDNQKWIEFRGNKVTVSYNPINFKGTFKIKDNQITFINSMDDELAEALGFVSEFTTSFERNEQSLFINEVEYIMQNK